MNRQESPALQRGEYVNPKVYKHCPKCQSTHINKYGRTHYGKLRFRCQSCGRQFVEDSTRQPVDEQAQSLIDKLLLERFAIG